MEAATGRREWIYPAAVTGAFQTARKWSFLVLIVFLVGMPWVRIGGHQLVVIDLPARQMHVAGSIYGATDTIFLVVALLFLSMLLFFVTALWGRIWCGYACPQTVFLETFVHTVERWIEGPRGKRRHLDRAPWTLKKVGKKVAKLSIFMAVSWFMSMTFVSWFTGTGPLWSFQSGPMAYGSVAFFTGVMFLDLAWFREQFCNYLCPYARFQGVLAGEQSLVITYDSKRGEPRWDKEHKAEVPREQLGACVDCNMCVAVCPTGIDIRDGYQLECIGCARCVDACVPVMAKFDQPTLVRYSTEARDEGRPSKLLNARVVIYGVLLAGLTVAFVVLLGSRHTLDVSVNRAAGTLFSVDGDGWTRNTFLLSVMNKQAGETPASLAVVVEGLPDAQVIVPDISLATGEWIKVPLVVRTPPGAAVQRTTPIEVSVSSDFDRVEVPTTFKSGTEG